MTKELTVGKITFNTNKPLPLELLPNWMIVNSIRYALGRQSLIVSTTCNWVILNWNWIGEYTRQQIKSDVENAFRHTPLGCNCDIKDWKRVRKLWRTQKRKRKNKEL